MPAKTSLIRKDGKKHCPCCKTWKVEERFNRDKKKPDGLRRECRSCNRNRYRALRRTGTSKGAWHSEETISALLENSRSERAWEWGDIPS